MSVMVWEENVQNIQNVRLKKTTDIANVKMVLKNMAKNAKVGVHKLTEIF